MAGPTSIIMKETPNTHHPLPGTQISEYEKGGVCMSLVPTQKPQSWANAGNLFFFYATAQRFHISIYAYVSLLSITVIKHSNQKYIG